MDEVDQDGLPIFPAAERNKQPILEALLQIISGAHGKILEISAATGQHAVHFAPHFPGYDYIVSDCDPAHLETLLRRLTNRRIPSLMGPLRLDVTEETWPISAVDIIYNANMMHIAPWEASIGLFRGAARILHPHGKLITYGPYRFSGKHTSESNQTFDASLKARNPAWGVRDVTELEEVARKVGMHLAEQRAMPACNFVLVWTKTST